MEGWLFKDYVVVGLLFLNLFITFIGTKDSPSIDFIKLIFVLHSKMLDLLKLKIDKLTFATNF